MNLISTAIELKHRLPRVWALMEALEVAPWKPKMVARLTSNLSQEATWECPDRDRSTLICR